MSQTPKLTDVYHTKRQSAGTTKQKNFEATGKTHSKQPNKRLNNKDQMASSKSTPTAHIDKRTQTQDSLTSVNQTPNRTVHHFPHRITSATLRCRALPNYTQTTHISRTSKTTLYNPTTNMHNMTPKQKLIINKKTRNNNKRNAELTKQTYRHPAHDYTTLCTDPL